MNVSHVTHKIGLEWRIPLEERSLLIIERISRGGRRYKAQSEEVPERNTWLL